MNNSNNKNYIIEQNRRYIVELSQSLNNRLKNTTRKELQNLRDVDTLVRTLIAPEHWERFGVKKESHSIAEYQYLKGLSHSAYWFIVNRIKEGRANIYESVEKYLSSQMRLTGLSDISKHQQIYFSKNKVKHGFKEADRPVINEIVNFVSEKMEKK